MKGEKTGMKGKLEKTTSEPKFGPDEVFQMLGAARYAEFIANQSASHVMQFLMEAQERKLHLLVDCRDFEELLEKFGFKKPAFYRERKLLLAQNPEQYDLFRELGLPRQLREQIRDGDVVVKGNEVIIGGDIRAQLGDSTVLKSVITRLVKDRLDADAGLRAAEQQVNKLRPFETKYAELAEQVKADHEATPYERSMGQLVTAILQHAEVIRHLDPNEHRAVAGPDLKMLKVRFKELTDVYETDMSAPAFQSDAIDEDNF
jgi:hypothetical protein